MGRAAADDMVFVALTVMQISRDEPCGEAQTARRLDKEEGKVPACADAFEERLSGRLGAWLVALRVGDSDMNGVGKLTQERDGIVGPFGQEM